MNNIKKKNSVKDSLLQAHGNKGWGKIPNWVSRLTYINGLYGDKSSKWFQYGPSQQVILMYLWNDSKVFQLKGKVLAGYLSKTEVSKLLRVSRNTAKKEIKILEDLGLIKTELMQGSTYRWYTTVGRATKTEEDIYQYLKKCKEKKDTIEISETELKKSINNTFPPKNEGEVYRPICYYNKDGIEIFQRKTSKYWGVRSQNNTGGVVKIIQGGGQNMIGGWSKYDRQYKTLINTPTKNTTKNNKKESLFVEHEIVQETNKEGVFILPPKKMDFLDVNDSDFLEISKRFRFLSFFNNFKSNTNCWNKRPFSPEKLLLTPLPEMCSWQISRVESIENVLSSLVKGNTTNTITGGVLEKTSGALWVWVYNDLYQLLYGYKKKDKVKFDTMVYNRIPALRTNDKKENGYHTTRILFIYALLGYAVLCRDRLLDFRESTFFEYVDDFMAFAHRDLLKLPSVRHLLGYITVIR